MKTKFDVSEEEKNRILNLVNDMKEKEMINEQLFGLWKGKKCTVKRCQEDGISDALIGSSKKHPKMTIDNERPEVGDRFRMKESRNGTLTGDSDWSDGHSYKVTKVETPLPVGYTYNFPPLSVCDSAPPSPTWDCDGAGTCSDPGTGNGIYASLSSCQSNCIAPPPDSWDCDGQGNCTDPGDGSGQYSLLNPVWWHPGVPDCSSNCQPPPPDPSWDCDGQGSCSDPGTGNGQYSSLNDCNNNCVIPAYRCHDCNTPCSQQLIDAGQCPYPTSTDCQYMCEDTNKWRCYRDKFGNKKCKLCKVYQMTDGTMCFNTKQECLASSECGLIRIDPKDPDETSAGLSNSTVSNGESKELDNRSEIKELALRRIVGKIIKSRR